MHIYSHSLKAVCSITLFISIGLSAYAQETTQVLMGTVRNQSNFEPISFASLKNEMTNVQVLADNKGQFIIPFSQGDLIKITAIGFEDGFYIVRDSATVVTDFPIQLKPRIYELKEFVLTPYKTVLQFKHAFTYLQLPEEAKLPDLGFQKPPPPGTFKETTFTKVMAATMHPVSFLYNTFSHKGKADKKYRLLVAADNKSRLINTKINREIVAKIVPLKTDEELDAFISYCQFDFDFLMSASDYELVAAIQQKYIEYITEKFN